MAASNKHPLQVSLQFFFVVTVIVAAFAAGRYTTIRSSERRVRQALKERDIAFSDAESALRKSKAAESEIRDLRRLLLNANRALEASGKRNDRLQEQLAAIQEAGN